MVHGTDRQLVRADLAGHVAIGGNAVSAHHDPGDALGLHQVGQRRVGAQGHRDAFVGQLPGGQARALQPRAGLAGVHPFDHAFQVAGTDHPQRGTEATAGQGAGIAVGEQGLGVALVAANQLDAVLGHGQVGFTVAFMDGHRFGLQRGQHVLVGAQALQALTHAVQRPEQVGGRGARLGQQQEVFFQVHLPVAALGQALFQRQHQAVGHHDADRRGAAHGHVADRCGHLRDIVAGQPTLLRRQQALVEQVQDAALPADRGHLLRRQKSLAHRLSPSFGYQKPAIIATLGAERSGILRRNFAKFQRTVQ